MTENLARAVTIAAVAALLLAGCGGESSGSDTGSGEGAAEPSKGFKDPEGPGGRERIATFGKESGDTEREEASAALAENLEAWEKADFATQCETLGKRGLEAFLGRGEASELSKCQKELESLAESTDARADTLEGEIAALRIKGNQAYALYHGSDGKDYMMPMEKEDGTWKAWSIVPVELPQS